MWGRAAGHRQAAAVTSERAAAEQAAQLMALLERPLAVDPGILRSFLDGASWTSAFDEFFVAHCPLFAGFGDGGEYSLELTAVHRQFGQAAEALLDEQLGEMAVTADTLLSQLMSDLSDAPPESARATVAAGVMERLEECADFERFGAMMRGRYEALQREQQQQPPAAAAGGGGGNALGEGGTQLPERCSEDDEFAREQQQIREASERRRRARMEAMRRAEGAADELDAELEAERKQQQEQCPHAERFAGLCTLCGEQVDAMPPQPGDSPTASLQARQPEPEPEPAAAQPIMFPEQSFESRAGGGGSGSGASNGDDALTSWEGWELGSVCRGTVSYWNATEAWGKIKCQLKKKKVTMAHDVTTTAAPATAVGAVGAVATTTYKTTVTTTRPGGNSTTVTRVSAPGSSFSAVTTTVPPGERDIYVHNTQLPMDAPRRWLQRGEKVEFIVGRTLNKDPQATHVVGVDDEGNAGAHLLCQLHQLPQGGCTVS